MPCCSLHKDPAQNPSELWGAAFKTPFAANCLLHIFTATTYHRLILPHKLAAQSALEKMMLRATAPQRIAAPASRKSSLFNSRSLIAVRVSTADAYKCTFLLCGSDWLKFRTFLTQAASTESTTTGLPQPEW